MIEKVVDATIASIVSGGWDYGTQTADPGKLLMRLKLPKDSCLGASHSHTDLVEDLFLLAPISEARDYVVGDTLRITVQKKDS